MVIDTNVFISSLIGQKGYSRRIFDELVLVNKVSLCFSPAVYDEYNEVANRERFKKYTDFSSKANELIEELAKKAFWFHPQEIIKILPDEDDDKFIELAIEANAGFIVTGNTNDFTFKEFKGIKICTPKEFYIEMIGIE